MATGQYIGVNGVARKVTAPYIGVNGVARNVKSGYVGVDGVARLFFEPESNEPVILEVEKITSDTYDGTTTFTGEEFVLLNIYPKKTGSIVNVTYGGLTKTITFTGTNAQPVFFGTFNGVTDSVATPSSGTLTISGDYKGFAVASYSQKSSSKTTSKYCSCITAATDISGITYLPSNAFRDCDAITSVTIPDGVTSIGSHAFHGCTNLALSSLPSGITSIGSYTFYGCTNLALTSLPNGITEIPSYAFRECTNLALTSLPSGVTSIGHYAFSSCTNLALTSLPSGITSIGNYGFFNCPNLALTSLHSGVTSIGESAFGRTNIKSINIPNTVTSIGRYPFWQVSLEDISGGSSAYQIINKCIVEVSSKTLIAGCKKSIIPSDGSVEIIGRSAFSGIVSSSLANWVLPASITKIEDYAFIGIQGSSSPIIVRNLTVLSTTPPTLGISVFGSTAYTSTEASKSIVFTVPKGCGATYKEASGWSEYAEFIIEEAT